MQDLMTMLQKAYFEHIKKAGCDPEDTREETVAAFVEFSKNLLMKNPPVATIMLEVGLGFRLADRTDVAVLPQPVYDPKDPRNGSIPITNSGYTRKDMQPPASSPITG